MAATSPADPPPAPGSFPLPAERPPSRTGPHPLITARIRIRLWLARSSSARNTCASASAPALLGESNLRRTSRIRRRRGLALHRPRRRAHEPARAPRHGPDRTRRRRRLRLRPPVLRGPPRSRAPRSSPACPSPSRSRTSRPPSPSSRWSRRSPSPSRCSSLPRRRSASTRGPVSPARTPHHRTHHHRQAPRAARHRSLARV